MRGRPADWPRGRRPFEPVRSDVTGGLSHGTPGNPNRRARDVARGRARAVCHLDRLEALAGGDGTTVPVDRVDELAARYGLEVMT